MLTVATTFGPVPITIPKETNRARHGLAQALDGIQKTAISVEDFERL